jgi:hypothetical protein
MRNGDLLRVAEDAGFDLDRNIANVILSRNRWRTVRRMIYKISAAVDAAMPGNYAHITPYSAASSERRC